MINVYKLLIFISILKNNIYLFLFKNCFNCKNFPNDQNLSNFTINNILIKECFFQRSNIFNGNGGILNIYNFDEKINIIIDSSTFYQCISNKDGGAIYIIYKKGNTTLKKICSYESCSKKNHFGIIHSDYSNNNKIILESSSIINSKNLAFKNSISTISLEYSNELINFFNSSKNFVEFFSSLTIFNSNFFQIIYSNFQSNYAIDNTCILMDYTSFFPNINYIFCNFILNISPFKGLINILQGNIIFNNCYFFKNSEYLFFS